MTDEQAEYDVVVIGAGVVGSATAYVLAEQGESCLLLEANPDAVQRYAGEWMHPTVTELMESFGLDVPEAAAGNRAGEGFVVFPEDDSEPIELPYPTETEGFCCSHYDLSVSVREQAAEHDNVDYLEYARAVDVQTDGRVGFHLSETNEDREVAADLVVGAGGRSSVARRALDPGVPRESVSYMAALGLEDVELPREGYGHIFMGGPGVALGYRSDADEVRFCLDVPADRSELQRDKPALYDAFEDAIPDEFEQPVREEMSEDNLRWSATFFQPRTERGDGRVALVGDAIGLCHPLCAAGVAVGFLDVALLAEAWEDRDLESYRRAGASETWVPELMSCAIYQLLGTPDSSRELREAVYRTWRTDPNERDRMMRILTGQARDSETFVSSFANVGAQAVLETGRKTLREEGVTGLLENSDTLADWARWPAASLLPDRFAQRIRPESKVDTPF